MPKVRDSKTIEKAIKKSDDVVKREKKKRRSLNGELSAAKRREKAQRQQKIGAAIEEVLGVGELADHDLTVLIDCFKLRAYTKNGSITTTASRLAKAILDERKKVSAEEKASSTEDGSVDQKPSAVPQERQDFTRGETGSSLPLFPRSKS